MRSKTTAALVKYRKLADVTDFDNLTFEQAVAAAKEAAEMRNGLRVLLDKTYGEYIARLSLSKSVKRGGLKRFCQNTGLNYGTVRNWRSEYLADEEKRKYTLTEKAKRYLHRETPSETERLNRSLERLMINHVGAKIESITIRFSEGGTLKLDRNDLCP